MPAPTKLRIAQQYIEAVANMTPPRDNPDLAALIASAKTNIDLMALAPETAPVRNLVNASGTDAQRHEEATRRAKHLTGSDSNNSGVLMLALCNLLDAAVAEKAAAPAQAAAAQDEEPDTFTTPDNDLNLLLELACDLSKGRCNMDTGIWWLQTLEGILARLMPKDLAVKESWPARINQMAQQLADRGGPDADRAAELQEIHAFLAAMVAWQKKLAKDDPEDAAEDAANAAADDAAEGVLVDGDIEWIPMMPERFPERTERILLADIECTVKQSEGPAVAELLAGARRVGVPCDYIYWARMPAVPTGSDLGAWRSIEGDESLPHRFDRVLLGLSDGTVEEASGATVRLLIQSRKEGVSDYSSIVIKYWRPMPQLPIRSPVGQGMLS